MKRTLNIIVLLLCSILVYASSTDKLRLLSLLRQTDFYITSGNYDKAAELREQALSLFKKIGAENDMESFYGLHKISHAYSEKEMHSEAVKTESLLVEIFPLAMPDSTSEYALYLNDLSLYLLRDKNYNLAEKTVKKALSLIDDDNDINFAVVYVRAAEIFNLVSPPKVDLSIDYQKKAVDIYAYTYGKTNNDYLSELSYLAKYYEIAGNYEQACNAYLEIMQTRAADEKENDMQSFLPVLDRIIFCSRKINNLEQVNKYKEIAFAIKAMEQKYHNARYTCAEFPSIKDSIDYLTLSERMGYFREQFGLYEKDEIKTQQIQEEYNLYLATQPDTYGKAYALSIETLRNSLIFNWKDAIRFGTEALQIFDSLSIITDKYVCVLCCVAEAYNELHNPAKAYDYLLRAYELRDDYLSSDNIYYNGIPSDLALYCSKLGNLRDAIKFGTIAVEAKEPYIYSDNSYGYFNSLNNLATYYGAIGRDDIELRILQQLIKRAEEIDPSVLDNPESPFMYNLAGCYLANGDYEKAIETGLRVKELREEWGGKSLICNIDYLLAKAYRRMNKMKEALDYAMHANSIQQEIGGDDNILLSDTFDLLAIIYKDLGQFDEAERMERQAINLAYNNIINNFLDLSSDDRYSYWNKLSNLFNIRYPNYFFQAKDKDASELYNKSALFAKGILLNTDTELTKLIVESGDEKSLAKYQQLLLNRSILSIISADEKQSNEISIDSIRKDTKLLERELIKECKVFGDYTANLRTTWQDVQKGLNSNDIAIEFLSFPLIDSSDSVQNNTLYAAIILRKNDKAPHFHALFDDEELGKIEKSGLYSNGLYNLIWGALDNYLSGIDNVYFSPTGKLYNINIEILPEIVGRNKDKNYYRISSTRLLAQHNNNALHAKGKAIIYGGLKYDTSISSLVTNSKLYKDDKTSYRGDIDSLDLRHGWKYLPGTLLEVNAIKLSLINNEISMQIYTDSLGTEASFKSYNGQPCEIIHIATHGFYYSENDSLKMRRAHLDYMGNQMNRNVRSYVEDYSLTRSGLLMAGCNNILRGKKLPSNIDDGVLFAKEISEMNMKNVELITLSSCDSGLGDVTGEGVFGLQRAFKKAGAQSILMALWKVDDNATRILMTRFYDNYLSKKMSKTESLKEAQRYVRTYQDGIFIDPKYWASFVLLDAIGG